MDRIGVGRVPPQAMIPGTCDVLVVGAGPAGAVAAHVLALGGLKTVLVDSVAADEPKVGESLPGAARAMLQSAGLLPWLERSSPQTNIGNLSSWGSAPLIATDFIFDPQGSGWHLDRARFDQCLREAAVQEGAILCEGRLRALSSGLEGIQATIAGQQIVARWVIDASGKSRAVARRMGATRKRDSPLIALYAWGKNRHPDTRSVVEAVADGWWYTAGLPGGARVAALHVLPAQAATVLRHPNGFASAMFKSTHIQHYCTIDDTWGSVQSTDAAGSWLTQSHGSHWIAVGDASIAFDPLSSQGLFNAIYTGLRGAQAVLSSVRTGNSHQLVQYGIRLKEIREAYRHQLVEYYRQERRWHDLPFWRNRHSERPSSES
ncbi:MAG TPA: tryptophan 7-halogenase [Luteibacter sp.]|uniref:NAD(P)/FAD-dependent oxidoreductase n=1 Tax=Luteibacter sp. TaxID=1886636 RepID=UPI002BAC0AF9|nr:tryptophan 7-halogenase [Luteibacter sp.]HVI53530.1 tryptophan 7-halogenase [Luteibacter sp.]